MSLLRVCLLGPVELAADGRPVTINRRMVRRLVAVLALDVGRIVSSEKLIDSLWGEALPQNPYHAIHMYVNRLRQTHPAVRSAVETAHGGYRLTVPSRHIDALRFEKVVIAARKRLKKSPAMAAAALEKALDLWRGDAFGDLRYDEFVSGAVRRLEELRMTAIEDRYDAAIRLGASAEVVPKLHQLASEHCLRDRPIELLMRAMQAAGHPNDARSVYRDYCERLSRDYGLNPSPALRNLAASTSSGNGSRKVASGWV